MDLRRFARPTLSQPDLTATDVSAITGSRGRPLAPSAPSGGTRCFDLPASFNCPNGYDDVAVRVDMACASLDPRNPHAKKTVRYEKGPFPPGPSAVSGFGGGVPAGLVTTKTVDGHSFSVAAPAIAALAMQSAKKMSPVDASALGVPYAVGGVWANPAPGASVGDWIDAQVKLGRGVLASENLVAKIPGGAEEVFIATSDPAVAAKFAPPPGPTGPSAGFVIIEPSGGWGSGSGSSTAMMIGVGVVAVAGLYLLMKAMHDEGR